MLVALLALLLAPWLLHRTAIAQGTEGTAGPRTQAESAQGADAPSRDTAAHDPLQDLTPAERTRLRSLLDTPSPHAVAAPAAALPAAPAAAATPAAAAKAAAPAAKPAPVSLAPDSLAGEVLGEAAILRRLLVTQTATFGHLFADMALTGSWLHREMVNPESRAMLLDAAWRSAALLGAALLVEYGLMLALRRPLRALAREARIAEESGEEQPAEEGPAESAIPGLVQAGPPAPEDTGADPGAARRLRPAPLPGAALPGSPILPSTPPPTALEEADRAELIARNELRAEARSRDAAHRRRVLRLLRRLPFALLRLALKLVPLAAFLAIGNLAVASVATLPTTQLVIITIANIYGVGRALSLLMDMLLAPRAPGVRLIQVADETARFLVRWWVWLLAIVMVALCVTDVGRVLDLPSRAGTAIVRAVILVEHILLAVLIWRTRHTVAASLRPPRRVRNRSLGRLLVRLADLWWVMALFFDGALWIVWAAQIRGGYDKMWRLFLTTVVIVLLCRFVSVLLLGALDRMFRVEADDALALPGFERRAVRYYPALRRLVTWALSLVCVVALAQGWGLPVLTFFTRNTLGTKLLSASISILVAMAIGVVIWELVNGALDRQIGRFADSNQIARAVRLQTLQPILRTLLFVVLGAILVLTVLSQIGVNIEPLLAGAGIIGVAVGFGSQKLVQDFITGIFLLVENAMQVGDTVTAAGVTGVVEHLSIRTLRLRGGDGSIQIIPFSSVSTVANMSRDYAVATIAVQVAFSEDTDRVCTLLTEIGADLRRDEAFADRILADFALNGVDSLGEYAVAISGTIRCTIAGRWPVQREFNRRLRARMEALGIALPQGLPQGLAHALRSDAKGTA